jgi:serine protease
MLCAPVAAMAADAGFTDRIIVKYRNTSAVTAAAGQATQLRGTDLPAARLGVTMSRLHATALGAQVLRVDRRLSLSEASQLARDIAASDPSVEYAEPDRILRHTFTPNDTRYSEQWHYFESTAGINAPAAWDKSTGSGVVVAVIDTGYRPHADLVANILPGYDFISDTFVSQDGNLRDSDASDPGDWMNAGECGGGEPATFESSSWHGTHVAGTIAAKANNATGVAGVDFNASLVICKALRGGAGVGLTSDVANCINWTHTHGAKVISMSLGGGESTTLKNAVAAAWENGSATGSVLVAAAGNDGDGTLNYPAAYAEVVSVAATDDNDQRASFSNANSDVEIAAPGVDVLSTIPGGQYAQLSGTSMATPHVSGVTGVLWQLFPGDTAAGIRSRLDGAVDDLGAAGRDTSYGFGRVNLCKAAGGGC